MQYQYTAEQTEFKDMLSRFVRDHYDYESRRVYLSSGQGFSKGYWQQLAELGVLGLPFSEALGGLDLPLAYQMAVAEEFGKGLVLEPFLPSVVMAGKLLAASDNSEARDSLIPSLIAGESVLALAWEERDSRGAPGKVLTRAQREGDSVVLNGEKLAVLAAPNADALLVTARDDSGDLNVYLVDTQSPGMTMTAFGSVDGQPAANLRFEQLTLPASAALFKGDALPVLRQILDESLVVMGAEAVGVMDQLLATTVEYCKTRKQFGLPIASFQALQHRIADMVMACERTRSLLWAALQAVGHNHFGDSVAMLKAELGRSGRYVGQQAVQLHGGIGMTEELNVGAYFKRLTAMEVLSGDRDYHLDRLAVGSD